MKASFVIHNKSPLGIPECVNVVIWGKVSDSLRTGLVVRGANIEIGGLEISAPSPTFWQQLEVELITSGQ